MMKKSLLLILTIACSGGAKDLGIWGDLYPIQEQDMLMFIQQRLKSMEADGSLAREQKAAQERVKARIFRPPPVTGLRLTDNNETHYIDPTFIVDKDIADGKGIVFAYKGNKINPLEHVPFRETLYFIDGDDKRQIDWMKQQKPDTVISKIVLVNGNIETSGEGLDAQVYFDQNGTLSRKFQLTAVPARVTVAADGKRLRIDTFAMEGEK
ncbi:conjugal transfer pilus assembly protein TraW [Pantoea agglomerans]|jgi:conjugal transfer pilus assembly protein TraW|uniref:type-F conjugative transfer system protein TraW n=1 Tax=Enterobacter agglomerans TaxID=549 RepID=UPI002784A214|nr:conjugal transfer pilus assembly protein TraW [Pantoea agglomerans]